MAAVLLASSGVPAAAAAVKPVDAGVSRNSKLAKAVQLRGCKVRDGDSCCTPVAAVHTCTLPALQ